MSHFAGIGVRGVRLPVTSGCWPFSCKLELHKASWTGVLAGITCRGNNCGEGNSVGSRVAVTTSHSTLQFLKQLHSVILLSPHTCDVATTLILQMKKVRLQGFSHKDMDLLRWSLDTQDQHIYGLTYELEYSGHYQWAHSRPWSESHLTNDSLRKESSVRKRENRPNFALSLDYPKLPTSLTDNAHSPTLAGQLGGLGFARNIRLFDGAPKVGAT